MMNEPTRIKICGIRDPQFAAETVYLGAHYIGIVMHPTSKRYVTLETANPIARAVKQANGIPVAVFVNHSTEEMKTICERCDIHTVQLHGDLSRQAHHYLPETYQRIYVIPVHSNGSTSFKKDESFKQLQKERDILLFDNENSGSGCVFNWDNLPLDEDIPFIVAGGLNPENVSHVINKLKPYGVDVSSGVESSPGIKDKNLIHQFIRNINHTYVKKHA